MAVLLALLTVGSLSDYVGRRPVLLVAIAMQAVTMLLFTTAHSVPDLIAARVLQGLSAGGALGALGAGDDRPRSRQRDPRQLGRSMIGTATGGMVSGLLVQYLPAPTHVVYLTLLGVFALQGAYVARMPETALPRPGALASLRPRLPGCRPRYAARPCSRSPLLVAT